MGLESRRKALLCLRRPLESQFGVSARLHQDGFRAPRDEASARTYEMLVRILDAAD